MSSVQETKKENINKPDVDVAAPQKLKDAASNSPRICAAIKEETLSNQGSIISLDFLKMGANSSTVMQATPETEEPNKETNNFKLRFEIYRPNSPIKAAIEEPKMEVMAPQMHHAIIEEPQIEILSPAMHVAIIEEPKVELITPTTYHTIIEEPKIGILRTSDGHELIMISDDDEGHQRNHEIFESAGEVDDNNNIEERPNLQAIDSHCCARTRIRERETRQTQTPRNRAIARQRSRISQPSSTGIMVGTSSNYDSSEQIIQKLKVNSQPLNSFKHRQLELHRHRIAVELKRLELLELKLARERDEMLRERILFEKELDLKAAKIRQITEDRLDL